MAKQNNYVQLIPTAPISFPVSRLAESENDKEILQYRLPAEFGFDFDDNIELHFYDSQNNLVNSTIVPIQTGIISVRSVNVGDGQRDEKLVIDMTRLQTELGFFITPGIYNLVINLFSDEIGSYGNRKLNIETISDSRTELRLGFNSGYTDVEDQELYEFVEPSLPRVLAGGVVSAVMGVNKGDIITNEQFEQAQPQQFVDNVNKKLLDLVPTINEDLADTEPGVEQELNNTIELASAAIYDEFVSLLEVTKDSKTFDRLQVAEMEALIERAVDTAFTDNNFQVFVQGKIQLI